MNPWPVFSSTSVFEIANEAKGHRQSYDSVEHFWLLLPSQRETPYPLLIIHLRRHSTENQTLCGSLRAEIFSADRCAPHFRLWA
jgi:hypothetical protein